MIVDTSLAVKWVVPESDTVVAEALLDEWRRADVRIVAPSWFACEVANALYQRKSRGQLSLSAAEGALDLVLGIVELQDAEPRVARRALAIADLLGERACYDAQYVALAERFGCEVWTADERFWRAAAAQFPAVRWIGALPQPSSTG